jgi:hypothetical protein
MTTNLAQLLFALDLLLLAAVFWAVATLKWRMAAGLGLILLGSTPMLVSALAGQIRPAGLLIFLVSISIGILLSGRR